MTVEKAKETMSNLDFVKTIADIVCVEFNLDFDEIKTNTSRDKVVAMPRQIAMYFIRENTTLSFEAIGSFFGGKDHATVMHACKVVKRDMLAVNKKGNPMMPDVYNSIKTIESIINKHLNSKDGSAREVALRKILVNKFRERVLKGEQFNFDLEKYKGQTRTKRNVFLDLSSLISVRDELNEKIKELEVVKNKVFYNGDV